MGNNEARQQALEREFMAAMEVLHLSGVEGSILPEIGKAMGEKPVFSEATYMGRRSVAGKLLAYAGVKLRLVNIGDTLVTPVRDRLVEQNRLELVPEAAAIQRDGHPQYSMHYLVQPQAVQ